MPYIKVGEIQKLIEIENYLGEKENWSDNTYKIWEIVEDLLGRLHRDNKKAKEYMSAKRKINKNYGRSKKNEN